jgi:hypothetical protein
MRMRAVLVIVLAALATAGCGKKNSLFLEPGRAGPDVHPADHRQPPSDANIQRVASAH